METNNIDNILDERKALFIQEYTKEGYTELEAVEVWDVFNNTYKNYLSHLSLPGASDNLTALEIYEYLNNSGELSKIKEIAFSRIDSL
jgi:hypothetical protein